MNKHIFNIIFFSLSCLIFSKAVKAVNIPNDYHIHLGGSIPLGFLQERAQEPSLKFKLNKEQFYNLTVADRFKTISEVIKNPQDIEDATFALINEHYSPYIEIRTGPKSLFDGTTNYNMEDYTKSFIKGLKRANIFFQGEKIVRGILSIDRSKHNLESALEIFKLAKKYNKINGLIIGIDISGLPYLPRKLSSNDLQKISSLAIKNNLLLTIHVGEDNKINKDVENKDTNAILDLLESYSNKYDIKKLVRFGHVYHTTEEQQKRIRNLQIKIEICPTCHELFFGFNIKSDEHPIRKIYQDKKFIILGTDDTTVFNTDIIQESKKFKFIYPES